MSKSEEALTDEELNFENRLSEISDMLTDLITDLAYQQNYVESEEEYDDLEDAIQQLTVSLDYLPFPER